MSRILFISALLISVVLIGGALWFRFFPTNLPPTQIVSIPIDEQFPSENTFLEDFYSVGASLPPASTSTLSQADLIGRQLFTDFMSLKSQGKTTSSDLQALAESYAKNLTNTDIQVTQVNASRVIVIPDSAENFTIYGNTMLNFRNKYKNLVATQSSGTNLANITGTAFSTFMGTMEKLYRASADELLTIGVPRSLVSNHLALINNYLENAGVMKLLSNTSKDPLQAYAALNTQAKNNEKESGLLLNIQKVMMANGIILNGSI